MKKSLIIGLAIALGLSLCACDSGDTENTNAPSTGTSSSSVTETPATEASEAPETSEAPATPTTSEQSEEPQRTPQPLQASILDIDFSNEELKDNSASKFELTNHGATFETDATINKRVAVFTGTAAIDVEGFSECYEDLQDEFTIETYFKVNDLSKLTNAGGDLIANTIANMHNGGFGFELYPNGRMTFTARVNGTYIFLEKTIEQGVYYHYVVTFDGSEYRMYVDGVLTADAAGDTLDVTAEQSAMYLCIGGDSSATEVSERHMDSSMSMVRIYDRAATADEATALYSAYTGTSEQ